MKVNTPEISWHGRDPVYSVDFQPGQRTIQRVATAGKDKAVRMWAVKKDSDGKGGVEFLSSLVRHTQSVNVIRFSPSGDLLASAGDDSVIIFWKLNDAPMPAGNIFQEEEEDNKEAWCVAKTLRGHPEDVYDLCWSADGKFLISGSVDNSAILWDTVKDTRLAIFNDHRSFVQGVAFDPLGEFAATLSSDRSCRIFNISSKNCVNNISKMTLPAHLAPASTDNSVETKPKSFRIFHDDTMRSFFRRLSFSPDGELLATPAGCFEEGEKFTSCTHIFSRQGFAKPVLQLPTSQKVTICAKFSPVLYQLRKVPKQNTEDKENNNLKEWEKYETVFSLPYRMVFAVATEDSVLLYDTQQLYPFAFIGNLHYHQLSDLSWTSDGRSLIVASTDGYCSLITFDAGELGEPYTKQVVTATKLIYPPQSAPSTENSQDSNSKDQPMESSDVPSSEPIKSPDTVKSGSTKESQESTNMQVTLEEEEDHMEMDTASSDLHLVLETSCDSAPTKTPTDDRVHSVSGDSKDAVKDLSDKLAEGENPENSADNKKKDDSSCFKKPESVQPAKPLLNIRSTYNGGSADRSSSGNGAPRRIQLTTLSLAKPK